MTLDEALDGKLKSPTDHSRAKVTITAITSKSGECVSRVVGAGLLVSQLYGHTQGPIVLTEAGCDNKSPALYLIARPLLCSCSPQKIMPLIPVTLKKNKKHRLSRACVTVCHQIQFDGSFFDRHTVALKGGRCSFENHTVPHHATCMCQSNVNTLNIALC